MSATTTTTTTSSPNVKRSRQQNNITVDPQAGAMINTLRVLCADVVQKANSGHPGAPMVS
jgi:hypothetical protein